MYLVEDNIRLDDDYTRQLIFRSEENEYISEFNIPKKLNNIIENKSNNRYEPITFEAVRQQLVEATKHLKTGTTSRDYKFTTFDGSPEYRDRFTQLIITTGIFKRQKTQWLKIDNFILYLRRLEELPEIYGSTCYYIKRMFVLDAVTVGKMNLLGKTKFSEPEIRNLARLKTTKVFE